MCGDFVFSLRRKAGRPDAGIPASRSRGISPLSGVGDVGPLGPAGPPAVPDPILPLGEPGDEPERDEACEPGGGHRGRGIYCPSARSRPLLRQPGTSAATDAFLRTGIAPRGPQQAGSRGQRLPAPLTPFAKRRLPCIHGACEHGCLALTIRRNDDPRGEGASPLKNASAKGGTCTIARGSPPGGCIPPYTPGGYGAAIVHDSDASFPKKRGVCPTPPPGGGF